MIEEVFLKFSAGELQTLTGRIEDCLGRLTDDQIWMRGNENENSAGNLVLHLCGNVTQWIGTGVAGRPDQRDRASEFSARGGIGRADLVHMLRTTMTDAISIIRDLPPARLSEHHTIQTHHDVILLEAIYHVVEHFGQHTAQIIFITKLMTGADLGYYGYLNKPRTSSVTP